MNDEEQKRFDQLYQRHVRALKLHGYAASTIDAYAHAVRRLVAYGEVKQLIAAARKLRYRVFVLTTYSMGLRVNETLSPFLWTSQLSTMSEP